MKILQLSPHFRPNIGGVETHLNDLVNALNKRGHKVFVLTYRPLTNPARWRIYEKIDKVSILRLPWIAGYFYKFVRYPLLEFLYLAPGLFLFTPLMVLIQNPEVIHAHGLVAGAVAVIWGKLLGKRVVISSHNIYHFPPRGVYRRFVRWVFDHSDRTLGLSAQAADEIRSLGVATEKVDTFTYWIDLKRFRRVREAKSKLEWVNKFVVLFVGRLIKEKGVPELLEAAKIWKRRIFLAMAGSGPLELEIKKQKAKSKNLEYLGKIEQENLPLYYSAADVLIVPSVHEEGFGRVILEALACGTPVVAARRGAIPEAMDETVGRLITVTPENIKKSIEHLYNHPRKLHKLARNARKFAQRRYTESNVEKIIQTYTN